jgi:hypothetical protein
MTVIVSVARSGAHQPPRVLVSTALWPPTVVFAFGMCQAGGEAIGAPLDEDSSGRQLAYRVAARHRFATGLVVTVHGSRIRLVLR